MFNALCKWWETDQRCHVWIFTSKSILNTKWETAHQKSKCRWGKSMNFQHFSQCSLGIRHIFMDFEFVAIEIYIPLLHIVLNARAFLVHKITYFVKNLSIFLLKMWLLRHLCRWYKTGDRWIFKVEVHRTQLCISNLRQM